jgi:homocysteine S-methyltransferase
MGVYNTSINLATESVSKYCALAGEGSSSQPRRNKLIAGSIGCYGAHLADGSEYTGTYDLSLDKFASGSSVAKLRHWHYPKYQTFLRNDKCHIIAFETVPCLDEVKAAVSLFLLGADGTDSIGCEFYDYFDHSKDRQGAGIAKDVWISLACSSSQRLNKCDETIEDALRAIEDPNFADLDLSPANDLLSVGVNCTSPEYVESIIELMKDHCSSSRTIVAYPNKGEVWDAGNKCWTTDSGLEATSFATLGLQWYEAGAKVIGGCCRVNPSMIAALKNEISQHLCEC